MQDLKKILIFLFSLFSAESLDEPELAEDGGRLLRDSEALLPQRVRRQVPHEVLQEPQGRTSSKILKQI